MKFSTTFILAVLPFLLMERTSAIPAIPTSVQCWTSAEDGTLFAQSAKDCPAGHPAIITTPGTGKTCTNPTTKEHFETCLTATCPTGFISGGVTPTTPKPTIPKPTTPETYLCWTPGSESTLFAHTPQECPAGNPAEVTKPGTGKKCTNPTTHERIEIFKFAHCPTGFISGDGKPTIPKPTTPETYLCWTPGSESTLFAHTPQECPAGNPAEVTKPGTGKKCTNPTTNERIEIFKFAHCPTGFVTTA